MAFYPLIPAHIELVLLMSALHYRDVIMSAMASQITGGSIICSIICGTICSGADQRKHQNSALLAFVRGIHRWPMVSPHKGLVTQKMFPFDDIMIYPSFVCVLVRPAWLRHCLHRRLSFWQLWVQSVTNCFQKDDVLVSVYEIMVHGVCFTSYVSYLDCNK